MDVAGVSKVCNGTFAESKVFTKVTGNSAFSNIACSYMCMHARENQPYMSAHKSHPYS